MKRFLLSLLVCFAGIFSLQAETPQLGVCTVRVANVFGTSVQECFPAATADQIASIYYTLANSNVKDQDFSRIHQLIFNEVVQIQQELTHEYVVAVLGAYVINKEGNTVPLVGHVLKEYITPITSIPDAQASFPTQPEPTTELHWNHNKPYVTLTKPFRGYSAGTRFNLYSDEATETTNGSYTIFKYEPVASNFTCFQIPQEYAILNDTHTKTDSYTCVQSMVASLAGKCPTVWGGASITEELPDNGTITKQPSTFPGEAASVERWDRTDMPLPRAGMDASGFFLRVCQICNMDFFSKNTTTTFALLDPIQPGHVLRDLDVVAFRGYTGFLHPHNNTITETRSYNHHSGMVRTIELSKTFKGIDTAEQLLEAYYAGTPLELLSDAGAVLMTVKSWKIAPFESLNLIGQKIRSI